MKNRRRLLLRLQGQSVEQTNIVTHRADVLQSTLSSIMKVDALSVVGVSQKYVNESHFELNTTCNVGTSASIKQATSIWHISSLYSMMVSYCAAYAKALASLTTLPNNVTTSENSLDTFVEPTSSNILSMQSNNS
jgi:hypothetical protein